MASAISFQGLASGLQTDALVNAILAQEGRSVNTLQARQAKNKQRTTALTSMKSSMNALTLSLASLQDKFNAQSVSTTDSNGTYVTASASGAATGTYDISVSSIATKGRISPTMLGGVPQNMAVDDASAAIFSGQTKAAFAVRGTDGVIKAFEVTNNSLYGLRDAINASGAGVTAAVINTGTGSKPYQLVITAKDTGTGTTSGVVTLAAIANSDGSVATVDPALGISTGSLNLDPLDPEGTGTFSTPKTLTGGLTSGATEVAKDAVFSINGIQLTRKSNTVTDAAEGVTFTLRQGSQIGSTTFTVAQDKSTITSAMQDVVSKFNALYKIYKDASVSTKNADGSITQGALSGDSTARSIITQIRSTLTGTSSGLPGSATFTTPGSLGLKTLADGTLSLDTATFQTAISQDPAAAKRLFVFSGASTNGNVAVQGGTAKTPTGAIDFSITESSPGVFSGNFTGLSGGLPFNIDLPATSGTIVGPQGSALEGLTLSVTSAGSGTLTLTRGAGQAVKDLISSLTAYGTGTLSTTLSSIETQNRTLSKQIDAGQSALERRKKVLEAQFSKLEVTIAQLKSSSGGLSGLQ